MKVYIYKIENYISFTQMKFMKIYKTLRYFQNIILRKQFIRFYSVESKKSEKCFPNIKHTLNEYINIEEVYKYFTNCFFSKKEFLKVNIARRKKEIDIDKLNNDFTYLKILFEKKNELEYLKFENAKLISDIRTKGGSLMNLEIDKIKAKGRQIKYELKELMDGPNGYRISENNLLPQLISLPVDLDPDTPDCYVTLHEEISSHSSQDFDSHLNFKNELLICQHEMNTVNLQMHYLDHNLSILEIKFVKWLHSFIKSISYFQHIICPDLVKRYIAEFCEDESDKLLFLNTEKGDQNHDLVLIGNSLSTYLSYLTSLGDHINSSNKFYRIGSSYKHEYPNNFGLYKASQNIQLDIFSTTTCELECKELFDESYDILKNLYASLQLPYKLVIVPAYDLMGFESKKIEAFLWSPAFKQYFKSGFIRSCKDIISRCFELRSKRNYLFMNHGSLISVPPFLASLVEHNQSSSLSTIKRFEV